MRNWIWIVVFLLVLSACSSINCPLNNRVATLYQLAGDVKPLADVLTISTTRTNGTDSVLLNQVTNVDSFILPVSYNRPQDVLYFERINTRVGSLIDTVVIEKQDFPHFESIDCNPSYFHVIKRVHHTRLGIDSIVINQENVNYDATKPHLLIYFKNFYQ